MQRNLLTAPRLLATLVLLLATAQCWATVKIKGKSETIQIELPDSWKEVGAVPNSPASAELYAYNEKAHALIALSVVEQTDPAPTLEEFLKTSLTDWKKTFGDLTASKPQSGRINKQDVLRCEVKFTFSGDKVGGVVSAVKIGTHYVMYLSFTGADRFSQMKSGLAKLSEEITEVVVPAGPDITAKAKDGHYQFTFTGDWKQQPIPINSQATYQMIVENRLQTVDLEVYSLAKADTSETLQQMFEGNVASIVKQIGDTSHTDPEKVKVGTFDALRTELSGTIKDFKISFVVTAIETPTQLIVVDENCPTAALAKAKPIMLKPLGTLKEITAVAAGGADDAGPVVLGKLVPMLNKAKTWQISLPRSWKASNAPPDADKTLQITAADITDDAEVLVLVDNRNSIALKDYTDAALKAIANSSGISNLTHTDPQLIKVNAKDATQTEIHCTTNGTKLAYLITIVQTDKSFIRSDFMTTESKFARMKPVFVQLVPGVKPAVVDDNSDDQ